MLANSLTDSLRLPIQLNKKVELQASLQTMQHKNKIFSIGRASKSLCPASKFMTRAYAFPRIILEIYILEIITNRERNLRKGFRYLPMEIYTSVDMNRTVLKDMDSIIGKMAQIIEDSSYQACAMVEELGK